MQKSSQRTPLTMSVGEVAKELGTTPDKVRSAIMNGTMPIGMVGRGDNSSSNRTIIIRKRWELWLEGELRV